MINVSFRREENFITAEITADDWVFRAGFWRPGDDDPVAIVGDGEHVHTRAVLQVRGTTPDVVAGLIAAAKAVATAAQRREAALRELDGYLAEQAFTLS